MEIDQQNPIHPGEILLAEFLRPLKISYTKLAAETGISVRMIGAIVRGSDRFRPKWVCDCRATLVFPNGFG